MLRLCALDVRLRPAIAHDVADLTEAGTTEVAILADAGASGPWLGSPALAGTALYYVETGVFSPTPPHNTRTPEGPARSAAFRG